GPGGASGLYGSRSSTGKVLILPWVSALACIANPEGPISGNPATANTATLITSRRLKSLLTIDTSESKKTLHLLPPRADCSKPS
ncbi:MAG: hypothetical protein ACP5QA_07880, partial [Phycisphaerae bacterium]